MKARIAKVAGGAVATAMIPPSFGVMDWRIIAGAAGAGAVAGFFGIDLAKFAKAKMADRKARKDSEL